MFNAYFDLYKDENFFSDPVATKTIHGYKDMPSIHKDITFVFNYMLGAQADSLCNVVITEDIDGDDETFVDSFPFAG